MIATSQRRREGELTFSVLVRELRAVYREQPRAFHVIAARYYLGFESGDELRQRSKRHIAITDGPRTGHYGDIHVAAELTEAQVQAIINNR